MDVRARRRAGEGTELARAIRASARATLRVRIFFLREGASRIATSMRFGVDGSAREQVCSMPSRGAVEGRRIRYSDGTMAERLAIGHVRGDIDTAAGRVSCSVARFRWGRWKRRPVPVPTDTSQLERKADLEDARRGTRSRGQTVATNDGAGENYPR